MSNIIKDNIQFENFGIERCNKLLYKGYKLRRKHWKDDKYIELKNSNIAIYTNMMNNGITIWVPTILDTISKDWEIVI